MQPFRAYLNNLGVTQVTVGEVPSVPTSEINIIESINLSYSSSFGYIEDLTGIEEFS